MYQGTSGADADASDHVLGHASPKERTEAKLVTELIVAEGKKLENLLCKCGCITDAARGRTVDEKRREELLNLPWSCKKIYPTLHGFVRHGCHGTST